MRTEDGGYSIDGSRGGRVISSDKDALFALWFYSINLQCTCIGVFRVDQGRADAEKADETAGANRANWAYGVDRADKGKADGDRADAKEPDRANGGEADVEEPDRADGGGADTEEPDGADGADRGGADTEEPDGDKADRDRADVEKPDGPSGVDVEEPNGPGIAARAPGLGDLWAEGQKVARQSAIWLSFFSFRNIFCLFFSSSQSETCGS